MRTSGRAECRLDGRVVAREANAVGRLCATCGAHAVGQPRTARCTNAVGRPRVAREARLVAAVIKQVHAGRTARGARLAVGQVVFFHNQSGARLAAARRYGSSARVVMRDACGAREALINSLRRVGRPISQLAALQTIPLPPGAAPSAALQGKKWMRHPQCKQSVIASQGAAKGIENPKGERHGFARQH